MPVVGKKGAGKRELLGTQFEILKIEGAVRWAKDHYVRTQWAPTCRDCGQWP